VENEQCVYFLNYNKDIKRQYASKLNSNVGPLR
jgi:hypothetical protein